MLPLTDQCNAMRFAFLRQPAQVSATGNATSSNTVGTIVWNNVGAVSGRRLSRPCSRRPYRLPGHQSGHGDQGDFSERRAVNPSSDILDVTLQSSGSIGDFIWRDFSADGLHEPANRAFLVSR
jgi:hypothetical protein